MAEAPAAIFSKEMTLSLEASVEDGVAQTQKKRFCTTFRSLHTSPRWPASSIFDRQK